MECKDLESRRQIGEFENGNAEEWGVSEVRWKGQGEIRSGMPKETESAQCEGHSHLFVIHGVVHYEFVSKRYENV
jgi:hypothetical protein